MSNQKNSTLSPWCKRWFSALLDVSPSKARENNLFTTGQVPGRPQGGRHGMIFAFRPAIQASTVTAHPPPTTTVAPALIIGGTPIVIDSSKSNSTGNPVAEKMLGNNPVDKPSAPPVSANQPIVKLVKLPASTIASSCDTVNSNQEQIVEKAKQEAYVMQRIAELQREGLWSEKRLPKVQEPPRPKAHWDYLLEEMLWLSTDFAQERKWKKSAAKKCARMVQKYFQEKALQAQKAEKLEELRLKKIASFIAKEVKTFWANVEKVVEYKQQTRLEEKRKKALDQQLNFIVDQTEKYSSWLTEGMNKTEGNLSTPASIHSSRIASPVTTEKHSDDDFKPNQCSDDDEETIAKAEEEMKSNHKEEIELLKKESELPLEELLPNYLENRDNILSPLPIEIVEEESDCVESKDTEFTVASDESSEDEEDTIQEQEKLEKDVDYQKELDELQAENEMSIEELMAKYGNASETPMDIDNNENEESESDTDKEDEEENESESESENQSESEDETQDDSQIQSDEDTTVNLKSLLEDLSDENKSSNEAADKQNEMDSVAAIAESIQPKGNTLLTTSVVTKIPFLLKHSLREYQHIGLDWLVTMYDRKLNGILADEMGLGKTIQTIALLAHLACEKGNWGPHLIVVPTSVMLNWEMECKKWCPGFKILTYYGTQKERKQKRTGWTKPNAFHICITSYKLVIQDHQSFRRKKWKYLILDEAQNIKNFKSQRWQLLLNFQTQRRLLLTGTPLQNNLMELWSLMHFLMPNVFQSHREFKEWFSNPVAGMIEGNSEYNENIIRRLHKVLRPFLLRRLKCEVEKQLPKKYEHVIMCRLSKRQRYLYDDFMSRAKTKETLATGNLLSVINVLMQLRKVCNHPNLFESRPTISPFQMEGIEYHTASLAWSALDYNPFKHVDLSCLNLLLVDLEFVVTAFVAHRVRQLKTPRKLIEEIDTQPEPPPRCPSGKLQMVVKLSNQPAKPNAATQQNSQQMKIKNFPGILPTPRVGTSSTMKSTNNSVASGQGVTLKVASGQQLQGYLQLVQHSGGVKAIPVGTFAQSIQSTTSASPTTAGNAQKLTVTSSNVKDGQQRYATQTYTVKQGDSVQKYQVPIFPQLIQANGKQILIHPNQQNANAYSFPVMTSTGQRLTVLSSKSIMGMSPMSVNKMMGGVVPSSAAGTSGRPVMRVPPLNVNTSQTAGQLQSSTQILRITKNVQMDTEKNQMKEMPKSEFYLPQLEEIKRQKRQSKLKTIADISDRRCAVFPLYGEDLRSTVTIRKPVAECPWHNGWLHCISCKEPMRTRRQYFSHAGTLVEIIKSTEQIMEELKEVFEKFVVYIPAAQAPLPRFHVSHPPPHRLWKEQRSFMELQRHLSPKLSIFHPITSAMSTQFPDTRLIQYDCGKLQSLDYLLRDLKVEGHRVLIFTQMTRMLDVLEAFLNYHGYIYLRLDGATKVDQRQVLMERFNNDRRIFCFILSTRSGGIGVNLTGADTVIFYDSDWNPTMDAQAQDRCHRIGQTRDVHIYRLISERTIEENILKKANQKRLLGDLAIEGGNFTTAYFKSSTIQDLFNVDQTENDASARMAEVLDQSKEREKQQQKESPQTEEKMAIGALESALAAVEEDQDVQAAKTAKAEAVADLAEFDENIPVEDADNDEAVSKAEIEVQNIVSQLTPVERYAMRFVEESDGMFSAAQLAAAERELEEQKKEWELGRLRAMREEEERQMRMTDDDENPLTFSHEDAKNQVNNNTSNSRRGVGRPPRSVNRRGRGRRTSVQNMRQRGNRRSSRFKGEEVEETTSDSEPETTSLSETDSQSDNIVPEKDNSTDEDRNTTRVESSDDYERENDENSEEDENNDGNKIHFSRKYNLKDTAISRIKKNRLDMNSPRTRSRGNVKINLWTLDVSPILPESKPRHRKKHKTNDLFDKSNENINSSFPLEDSISKTMSELVDSGAETSHISDANESMQFAEDTPDTTVNSTPDVRTRRSTVKLNLKLSDSKDNAIHKTIGSTTEELKSGEDVVDDKIIGVVEQEINIIENRDTNSTPHKVRLRKSSQSSVSVTSEPNATVTYSTRSSKLLSLRPLQEKKLAALKIKYNEEHKICDTNDTVNDTLNEEEKQNDVSDLNVPNDNKEIQSNKTARSQKINEDYQIKTSSISEYHAKSLEKEINLSEMSNNAKNLEEDRPLSPILSVKRVKLTRSYSRASTKSKDDLIPCTVILDDTSKQTKSADQLKVDLAVDQQELNVKSVETDFNLSDTKTDNTTSQNVSSPTCRASPILSTKRSKITRSNARLSNIETSDKSDEALVKNTESQEKLFVQVDELKSAEKSTALDGVTDTQTENDVKSANLENLQEQVKTKKTRSSTRLVFDDESIEINSETSIEQIELTPGSVSKETFVSVPKTKTEKSSSDMEKLQIETKTTQSLKKLINESFMVDNPDTDVKENQLSNVLEKSENCKNLISSEKLITDSNEKLSVKITSEPINSPENELKDSTISTHHENSASKSNELSEEMSSTRIVEQKSSTEFVFPETTDTKLIKPTKSDTIISGMVTRRSKIVSNIEDSSQLNENSAIAEQELNHSTKVNQPRIDNLKTTTTNETVFEKPSTELDESVRFKSRRFQSPPKPFARRRPDTPMPEFHSIRPVTRSLANNHTSNSDSEGSSTSSIQHQLKLSPRSPRTSMDNGFVVPSSPPVTVRRSRSTTYVKMSDRLAMERKEIAMPIALSRGHYIKDNSSMESLKINRVISKRRPDTPLPTPEQFAKLTKPNLDVHMPSPKSLPPIPKLKHIRRAVAIPQPHFTQNRNQIQQQKQKTLEDSSTDSNGNSLDSDVESSPTDKPQRTAKVVAILSLETKPISKSANNQQATSPSQRTKLSNADNTLVHNSKSAKLGKGSQGSKLSTTASTVNKVEDLKRDSTVITTVDLDDEPDFTEASQTISRRTKRTRLNPQLIKTQLNKSFGKKDIQMIEIEDDEEEKALVKKSK